MSAVQRKFITFGLALVWLGVVGASVYIVITQRERYGWWVYLVPAMAVFMLVCFVAAFLPARLRGARLSEWAGRLSAGALILAALAVLGYALLSARASIFAFIVLGVFFITFLSIFRDYIQHLRGEPRKRRRR